MANEVAAAQAQSKALQVKGSVMKEQYEMTDDELAAARQEIMVRLRDTLDEFASLWVSSECNSDQGFTSAFVLKTIVARMHSEITQSSIAVILALQLQIILEAGMAHLAEGRKL